MTAFYTILKVAAKLQLDEFLDGKKVYLVSHGKKIKLAKNDIFGYRLQEQDFRFYNNEAYRIIDSAGFLLYGHSKLVQQGKGQNRWNNFILALTLASLCWT